MKSTFAAFRFLATFCCLFGALVGQAPAPHQQSPRGATAPPGPSIDTGVSRQAELSPKQGPVVPVLISATDSGGNPITTLTKDQITIVDGNEAVQPIQLLKGSELPLRLGIVLFSSPSSLGLYNSHHLEAPFSEQKAAAIELIKRTIQTNTDEAFVVTSGKTNLPPSDEFRWTQDPAELTKTIAGMNANVGVSDLLDENEIDTIYQMYSSSDPWSTRRTLVIFRTAWSHSPLYGTGEIAWIERQTEHVIALAQDLHITTFVVGLEDRTFGTGAFDSSIGRDSVSLPVRPNGGLTSSARDREQDRELAFKYTTGKTNLQRIATETGGTTFWTSKKNCSDAVRAIANQIAGQYIVTFTPISRPDRVHRVKITSSISARILAQAKFSF